mgnify:CR=1 FL=1
MKLKKNGTKGWLVADIYKRYPCKKKLDYLDVETIMMEICSKN